MVAVKSVCSPSGPPTRTFFLLLLGSIFVFLAAPAFAGDTILPGEGIYGNQTLISKNGVFELGFFSPGLDIYHFLGVRLTNLPASAGNKRFWFGDRVYITDLPSAALVLFNNSLNIMEAGHSLWVSSSVVGDVSPPPAAAIAVLLDTGNLVVRDQANSSRILWQSFDCPGDTLLPGGKVGFDRDTGKNISLTYTNSWHNSSLSVDRSRRNGFVLTTDGQNTILGTFPDWMVSSQENGSSLVLNYSQQSPDFSEHLQLHLGQVSLRSWSNSSGLWVDRWTFPSDCKSGAFFCGRFGACKSDGKCKCFDGFEPSKPSEWQLGYFVNGCSRSLPLSCEANSGQITYHDDSFVPLHKLQGLAYNPQNDSAESDKDCREACVSKCYCVAYAYDTGCKLWYHTLYNVSFATRPPYSKVYVRLGSKITAQKGLRTIGIVLIVVGVTAAACVILILALLWRYRKGLFTCRKLQVEGPLAVYPYAQVKRATRNFSDKLGEGAFGCVFRGTMPGSTVVAVKRLKGLGQANKQFRAEVQTLGVIQHTNLVRLLGFCVKGNNTRLLVYEYMANGSLDSHLFSEDFCPLIWDLRYRIALGIAKGLAYLHEECEDCIIHCDIKPANILLDAEFRVKIADFGMAKLLGREFSSALTTLRGTMGYLAPEWVSGQRITRKADVYSFGIVLLEIISGRRTTKRLKFGSHRYFPLYAAAQLHEGDALCLLDRRLEGNANVKELDVACRVACWCIQDEEGDRPSMGQVVRMLEGVLSTEIPPVPSSFMDLVDGEDSSTYSEEGWRFP